MDRKYAVYERDDSGTLGRRPQAIWLSDAMAAEYPHPERLRGWPETVVLWRKDAGPSIGIARSD